MKPITTIVKVEITKLKVDGDYFSFNYTLWVNDIFKAKDSYSSDHGWHANELEKFKENLKNGYAAQLALDRLKL